MRGSRHAQKRQRRGITAQAGGKKEASAEVAKRRGRRGEGGAVCVAPRIARGRARGSSGPREARAGLMRAPDSSSSGRRRGLGGLAGLSFGGGRARGGGGVFSRGDCFSRARERCMWVLLRSLWRCALCVLCESVLLLLEGTKRAKRVLTTCADHRLSPPPAPAAAPPAAPPPTPSAPPPPTPSASLALSYTKNAMATPGTTLQYSAPMPR